MANPFENDDAQYQVLVNDEGQHSLWPVAIEVPAGWTARFGPAAREACLAHVEEHWTDMRPLSLVREMDASS
ncbi:MbtH family protein [Kitasatospora sp. NBC_01250]|uniref:MbtH family protein n=1 Tax=unclassified Kitasatospora TaxID=2633591 RepID=UPI002E0D599C|nr:MULTISPECIES: MbtH family protein [unclassified Kitasatospora]WSJ70707.1 MbtH family protein [Kitasatospora sp. NBC_01302]